MKLATLSFDDGGWQEFYVLDALNAAGVAATFYLCSSWLDKAHYHVDESNIPALYAGQEVGCHSASHPDLRTIPDDLIVPEIFSARRILQATFGQKVECFSWPFGAVNPDIDLGVAGFRYGRGVATADPMQGGPFAFNVSAFWPVREESWRWLEAQPAVHVMGHAYQVRDARESPQLTRLIERLKAAGFQFVVNSEFWRSADHAHS